MSPLFEPGGSFSVDGVHSDTWHMFLRGWTMPLLPSLRINLQDIPGRSGKANDGIEYSSKVLALDITATDVDKPTILQSLRAFGVAIDPKVGSHKIRLLDDMPGFWLPAVPTSDILVTASSPISMDFVLTMEAYDPFWYFDAAQHITWVAAKNGTKVLPNAGNESTPVVITITRGAGSGVLTALKFTFGAGGPFVQYNGSIIAGDTVIIDTGNMTVLKNGVNDIANWSSDFPYVPPGGVTVTYTETNTVGANVTFDYNERNK